MSTPRDIVRGIADAARAAGRSALLEDEGYRVLEAYGVAVPACRATSDARDAARLDMSAFSGDRVVVKVASPEIAHKSDVGGVAIVPRDAEAVARAVARMERAFRDRRVERYLVTEYVDHGAAIGSELLVGLRFTGDFGAVLTLGAGGVFTEALAGTPGGVAILSAAATSDERAVAIARRTLVARIAEGRLRGQAASVAPEAFAALVGAMTAIGRELLPEPLREIEINPVALGPRGAVAIDVLARIGDGPIEVEPPRPLEKMERLVRPRSIAVAGVSRRINPGRIILRNTLREGFDPARIWVVKPGVDRVDGCVAVPDVEALPERVDLLVLSVDAERAVDLIERAIASRKAESLIVIPGGLEESAGGASRAARVRDALRSARSEAWRGPLLVGGNCLGVRSKPGRYDTLFIPTHKLPSTDGPTAALAVISQSGAFAVAQASRLGRLNPRILATIGNQSDLTLGDWLEHLRRDPEIRVFACYVEGFRPLDGLRVLEAARAIVDSGRTVVLYRAGRTAAGALASASHTASIAGDFEVCRSLAAEAGVVVADGLGEFEDLVRLHVLLGDRPPAGARVGAITNAGFECVAIADRLGALRLADLSADTVARLEALFREARLGEIVSVRNPADVTPMLDDAGYEAAVRAILDDPAVDVGVVGCVPLTGRLSTLPPGPGHGEDLARDDAVGPRLVRIRRESTKPWVAVVDAGRDYDPLAGFLEDGGIPTFRSADVALRRLERWVLRK